MTELFLAWHRQGTNPDTAAVTNGPEPHDAMNTDNNGKSAEGRLQELSLLEDKFAWQHVAHFIFLQFPSGDIGPLAVWV